MDEYLGEKIHLDLVKEKKRSSGKLVFLPCKSEKCSFRLTSRFTGYIYLPELSADDRYISRIDWKLICT